MRHVNSPRRVAKEQNEELARDRRFFFVARSPRSVVDDPTRGDLWGEATVKNPRRLGLSRARCWNMRLSCTSLYNR